MEDFLLDAVDLKILNLLQTDASLSNVALSDLVNVSPPTCLRRVKRLIEGGWIERQVALLSADHLSKTLGHGMTALVEVSLDKQGAEYLDAFEAKVVNHGSVQQCWRVSPGPDFILVVQALDMPHYLRISQELFTENANVRNVKAYFATKRAKFGTQVPLFR
ncbi:MAG: AsnC family transcriptional regulator [Comamonadaceae bacterium PBBC2]|nr:MAG: AsnC family transcriptional regulator [Comamonadaceae bacterium PBBC2]